MGVAHDTLVHHPSLPPFLFLCVEDLGVDENDLGRGFSLRWPVVPADCVVRSRKCTRLEQRQTAWRERIALWHPMQTDKRYTLLQKSAPIALPRPVEQDKKIEFWARPPRNRVIAHAWNYPLRRPRPLSLLLKHQNLPKQTRTIRHPRVVY